MRRFLVLVSLFGCGKVEDISASFTVEAQPDAIVREGGTVMVEAIVNRTDGFDGSITVEATGLPEGVTSSPVTIDGGSTQGTLELAAAAGATHGIGPITIAATADEVTEEAAVRLAVAGAPGAPDRSFAGTGTYVGTIPGMVFVGRGLTIAGDKIVVTGSTGSQAITARFSADGTFDTSFGGGTGFVSTGVGSISQGLAVKTHTDNRLIVAGTASATEPEFGVFAYTPEGVLDESFGNGGVAMFDGGMGTGELHSMQIASDGSIIVVGSQFTSPLQGRALRFTAQGDHDVGFGATVNDVNFKASALQPDGKVILVGATANQDFYLARINASSTVDPGFGMAGIVTTPFGTTVQAVGIALVDNGKIVVGGTTTVAPRKLVLARYNNNGSLDLSFGTGGKVISSLEIDSRSLNALVVDAEGRILLVGRDAATSRPRVARLLVSGEPDTSFGEGGLVTIDHGIAGTTQQTGAYGIALDAEGRIVFTGEVGNPQHMVVGRLWF